MDMVLGRTRKLSMLRKGDIININVPFEENTRDYFNGYKPEEIRGGQFTDRFGKSSKKRMVVYIGRDAETMLFLTLTSKGGSKNDHMHQYPLKDNSMTPRHDPDMKSYVEVSHIRAMRVSYGRNLSYTGRLAREDLDNILHRISNSTLQFNSRQDQRGYVPAEMEGTFAEELAHRGFLLEQEQEDRKIYAKPSGETITRTKYGMVHYHIPLSKEQVASMVRRREEYAPKAVNRGETRQKKTNAFIENVNNLTNMAKEGKKLSYGNTC